jgi:transcriptional regulator with XRE-family HTH domain
MVSQLWMKKKSYLNTEDRMNDGSINLVRGELIKRYGRQYRAANELGFRESRLSSILCGRVNPTPEEREKLRPILGVRLANRFFGEIEDGVEA